MNFGIKFIMAFVMSYYVPRFAETGIQINPTPLAGRWEGWGTSLAWWGHSFGDREDLADVFFTLKDEVTVGGNKILPGLGMNIARYNAGGR